jgi:hypothetical protein
MTAPRLHVFTHPQHHADAAPAKHASASCQSAPSSARSCHTLGQPNAHASQGWDRDGGHCAFSTTLLSTSNPYLGVLQDLDACQRGRMHGDVHLYAHALHGGWHRSRAGACQGTWFEKAAALAGVTMPSTPRHPAGHLKDAAHCDGLVAVMAALRNHRALQPLRGRVQASTAWARQAAPRGVARHSAAHSPAPLPALAGIPHLQPALAALHHLDSQPHTARQHQVALS